MAAGAAALGSGDRGRRTAAHAAPQRPSRGSRAAVRWRRASGRRSVPQRERRERARGAAVTGVLLVGDGHCRQRHPGRLDRPPDPPPRECVGFSTQTAALISGIYGLGQISLRFGVGWLGDIFGRRGMYAASFVLQGVGLIVFAHLSASRIWMLPVYFAVFATGHAAWVVFQQTMVADYFGVRRFATLRGFAGALQTPVGVVAPFLAGWMFDRQGNYELIFTIYGLIATTGALWVMLIRRPLWVDPETAEAESEIGDKQARQHVVASRTRSSRQSPLCVTYATSERSCRCLFNGDKHSFGRGIPFRVTFEF
ncbi:MAG: MFS transporter [Dehalococcoidia bacterium]|nr:MFS transporter [Dehalococcoidia bacterium]